MPGDHSKDGWARGVILHFGRSSTSGQRQTSRKDGHDVAPSKPAQRAWKMAHLQRLAARWRSFILLRDRNRLLVRRGFVPAARSLLTLAASGCILGEPRQHHVHVRPLDEPRSAPLERYPIQGVNRTDAQSGWDRRRGGRRFTLSSLNSVGRSVGRFAEAAKQYCVDQPDPSGDSQFTRLCAPFSIGVTRVREDVHALHAQNFERHNGNDRFIVTGVEQGKSVNAHFIRVRAKALRVQSVKCNMKAYRGTIRRGDRSSPLYAPRLAGVTQGIDLL